ncbi:glycine C-acetyltransferase/8-amino-7-oxononanoate synthase [Marininema mesophilum]|uniref:8-amino-7-ketopelargonate synthase n=1 Tax=Marininema mesophilum TaxID=1048340 RepID=A0A1H2W6I7_9BACL|nr:8-amino-7-oxononanoate synthase [Marininema mesophilum]SDW76200.1 glycine C-acetyltransferase/8-amino-7-oxononanoate synthase [Marininema mesophilum]
MSTWDEEIRQRMAAIRKQGRLRESITTGEAAQPVVVREGKRLINLSSNNYLGLAGHPAIISAQQQGAEQGAGATASRLIVGYSPETAALEAQLATYKGCEDALIFTSGYTANVGVLSALLRRNDGVFSDRLNHASIVDGIRLSGARPYRYRHRDLNHLEAQLKEADRLGIRNRLIVTDTVFSMDGDIAPLREIIHLKEKYGAALMVDDAHGSGVFGPEGKGTAYQLGVADGVDLHMGTFSKAYGVYGAYVAGKKEWLHYLVNTCRSLIYTTALPPTMIAGITTSLELIRQGEDLRRDLAEKSSMFRNQLRQAGFDTGESMTQIVPIMVGGSDQTLQYSRLLSERGVLSVGIRPPTVPDGEARLRFSLMATMKEQELQESITVIVDTGRELGVI